MRVMVLAVALSILFSPCAIAQIVLPEPHPDDIYWEEGFYFPGQIVQGSRTYCIAKYGGNLVLGHEKLEVSGRSLNTCISAWDGSAFETYGSGIQGWSVYALVEYDGLLIAGGDFDTAGSALVNNIAAWDGESWQAVGEGLNYFVRALAVYDNKLVAGGYFDSSGGEYVSSIAIWDGNNWKPLGPNIGKKVEDLVVYQGSLYAGGLFPYYQPYLPGPTSGNIARWDGRRWSRLKSGTNGRVLSMMSQDGHLIVGGSYTESGDKETNNISAWDGSDWLPLGRGTNGPVEDLGQYHGDLVAVGDFTMAGNSPARHVAAWDGIGWHPIDTGLNRPAFAVEVSGDSLVVGGKFVSGEITFEHIVSFWDGDEWTLPYGNGARGNVTDIEFQGGDMYVLGSFGAIGNKDISAIAAMTGSDWTNVLRDYRESNGNYYLHCLQTFDSKLIVGGNFRILDSDTVLYIAQRDGANWSRLGEGFDSDVNDLLIYNGSLIAAGDFITSGVDTVHGIARWDGQNWTSLGRGLRSDHAVSIQAMIEYEGNLIVGGWFDSAGTIPANNIAAWDGTQWSALGGGFQPFPRAYLFALEEYNGKLIAGGFFESAGHSVARNVAAWDGSQWSNLGEGLVVNGLSRWRPDALVFDLEVYGDELVVGGIFDFAGRLSANNIASWDGAGWAGMGSGISKPIDWNVSFLRNGAVNALLADGDKLWVGGDFIMAGDKVSANIACWTKGVRTDVTELFPIDGQRPDGYQVSQNYPNPFNPSTTIEYFVPVATHVTINIFNLKGQRVRMLVDEAQTAGSYRVVWDGNDADGKAVASGVYFYHVSAGEFQEAKKMLLVK